jgi:hypothetical protein
MAGVRTTAPQQPEGSRPSPAARLGEIGPRLASALGAAVGVEICDKSGTQLHRYGLSRTGGTDLDVVIKTDSVTLEGLLNGSPTLVPALATGRVALVGDTCSIFRFWGALAHAVADQSSHQPPPGRSLLSCYESSRAFDDRLLGFPPGLSEALMDRMLVLALLLAGLPSHVRAEELTKLWTSFARNHALSREAVGRLLVSVADLAAGNTEQAKLRVAVEAGNVQIWGRPGLTRGSRFHPPRLREFRARRRKASSPPTRTVAEGGDVGGRP